jgi:hypothetical protein
MQKRTLGGLGQNEPNFKIAKMNASSIMTKDYQNIHPCGVPKNKPNSNPILTGVQMTANFFAEKG